MIIKEIKMRDFRNYGSLDLQFHKNVNIFLGNNGQGKTNILEAIYTASIGKSFRTKDDKDLIRFGAEFAYISVLSEKDDDDLSVELAISGSGKAAKVDGIKIKKNADLLENIYAVIFSPEDLKIVKEDPEKRRKFMDTEISRTSRAYYSALSSYKKIIKQRNTYLKDAKFGQVDKILLETIDEQLATYGADLMRRRALFVRDLAEISKEIHAGITGGIENLVVEYEPSIPYIEGTDAQKNLIIDALRANYQSDLKNGTTSVGPHRDDISICLEDIDIRKFGSQGQQRTAALALKLAELSLIKKETGENAVLLLDDVMSELDSTRQNFLISSLSDVQLFITTTELSEDVLSKLPEGYIFNISKGTAEIKE